MAVDYPTPNLTAVANIDKTEIRFYSYGILTLPIIPLLLLAVHIFFLQVPQIYLLLWLIIVIKLLLPNKKVKDLESSTIFTRIIYVLVELTFGVRTSRKSTHQFRMEWFLLFGGPIVGLILLFVYASLIFIIPAIIIIIKRKWFVRNVFKFALLPRSEYFVEDFSGPQDEQEMEKMIARRDLQEQELQYQQQKEYLHFYQPKKGGRFLAYFFLFIIPILLIMVTLIFLALVFESDRTIPTDTQNLITSVAGAALFWSYVGMIPYLILSLFRKRRLTKFVASSLAEGVVSTITSTSVNYLPIFNGEYYFEHNSRVVDMSDNYAFFEIFKSGRWFTILLLPLSAVSFIFTQILEEVDNNRGINSNEPLTKDEFLKRFSNQILTESTGTLIFFVVILLPIFISIILPLMWVLKDSELKKITWENDEGGTERKEISGVEDLGHTLNRIFGLFLGFSTITGLSAITSDLVNRDASTTDIYIIVFVMILIGAMLVLPGTLFMAYRYFSLGDHAAGVNYLRYHLSQSEYIGVGTIVKGYDTILTLPDPLSPTIKNQITKD